jgi:hypothetical protein
LALAGVAPSVPAVIPIANKVAVIEEDFNFFIPQM